ncbi:MAG: hypothetical protein COB78_09945 [Hyphomicrobiales bacterium]|nr:MAG: hypothetical protein COB78_09945 [Hyphomicrobiales bacterium]
MTPTFEEMLEGATTWRKTHMGVGYVLSHHGHRTGAEYEGAEYHPGTWCYYLLIPEQMYPHRWDEFKCVRHESGFNAYPKALSDHDLFDTEVTFAESLPYWSRDENRQFDLSKVGCDYGHSWHHDQGYPDTFRSVNMDAQRTVEKLLKTHPDFMIKSGYSNVWGDRSEFYEAVNGKMIHKSKDKLDKAWLSKGWEPAVTSDDSPSA